MKKTLYFSFAALIALVGCSKEQNIVESPLAKNLATIEISLNQTKATINDEGTGAATFSWEENDEIGVVVGGVRYAKFTLTELSADKAKFTGVLEDGETLNGGEQIAYPYNESDFENNAFNVSFPDSYEIDKPTRFRLRWAGTLTKNDDGSFSTALDHTSGIFRVTYNAVPDLAKAVVLTQGGKTVTLNLSDDFDKNVPEGENGISFYFPVQAGTLDGFTVALSDGENLIPGTERSSTKSFTYANGKIYRTPLITLNVFEKVTSLSPKKVDGNYILVYPNGTSYRLFSFQKAMENAEVAADLAKDTHGLDALLKIGSSLYSTVVANNCLDVTGPENATAIILTPAQEKEAVLSITKLDSDHTWATIDGKTTLTANTDKRSYSLAIDHTIVGFNGEAADVVAAFNAPGLVKIAKDLRGTEIPVTFQYLINFAVDQAKKEGVTFSDDQIDRLESGFEHLCRLAKTMVSQHPEVFGNNTLMDIDLGTNVLDVFSRYYDNATSLSWSISEEKRFGLATLGYHAYDKGFTFNVGMPNYGWFTRLENSLKGTEDECIAYWAQFDEQYKNNIPVENFFSRAARKAVNELDDSTYKMLHQMALQGKFTAIGNVYKKYVTRFNDQLEPVYIYKKVE